MFFINIVLQFFSLKTYKSYIAIACLFLFLNTKFAALHALTHSEDEFEDALTERCDFCECTVSLNKTFFVSETSIAIEQVLYGLCTEVARNSYAYQFSREPTASALFCRPPTGA